MAIETRLLDADQNDEFFKPFWSAFGMAPNKERAERVKRIPELTTRIGAYTDEGSIVGSAGAFEFDMSTPGGRVDIAGLTLVAVLATHRRRGVLTSLIRRHFEEARAQGRPVSALWASEGQIYGRFGYGVGSYVGSIAIERHRSGFASPDDTRVEARFVSEDEALELFPQVWERARKQVPGMLSRSIGWWKERRLVDTESMRGNAGALERLVIEREGVPIAYALYRLHLQFENKIPKATMKVIEAISASPLGTRLLWRYLLSMDLTEQIEMTLLVPDHPLFLLLAEPRRLRFTVADALWVRILDVPAALRARRYGAAEAVVIEVSDAMCPWNEGRYRVGGPSCVERTDATPDLRLSIAELSSLYLGGISMTQLVCAGRAEVVRAEAVEQADVLFRSARAPWCPDIF